jgi:hypothetical protein
MANKQNIKQTPSRSSPRGGKRGCLCKDTLKYSVKCCDGSLWAQGIGPITGTTGGPIQIPYFWGVSNTPLNQGDIKVLIESGNSNVVNAYPNGDITLSFQSVGQYIWIAYQSTYLNKTKWYNSPINQGQIGTASDLFNAPSTVFVNYNTLSLTLKYYVSNYATTTNGAIIFKEL